MMNTQILTVLVALNTALCGYATDVVQFEQVHPVKSAKIQWTGTSNQTIDGKLISSPISILLTSCSNIVISACDLRSIQLIQCQNVSIFNCWIHNSSDCGVQTYESQQVLVQGCRIESVSTGVEAIQSQQIQVVGNFCRNVRGPFPRGQMAQFNNVTGTGNIISGNYSINDHGKSHPEDSISIYESAGTADSPILIANNYLTGDPTRGSAGKSKSGSGIQLGDTGGAYELCQGNVIISAGQEGLGVAGGNSITVQDNIIYGQESKVSNVGLDVWNQSGQPSDGVSIIGNRVFWVDSTGEVNSWWDGGGVQDLQLTDNQFDDSTLPASLPAPPSQAPNPPQPWLSLDANNVSVARIPWNPSNPAKRN